MPLNTSSSFQHFNNRYMSQQENQPFYAFQERSQVFENNHMVSGVDVMPDTWRSSAHYLENSDSPLKEPGLIPTQKATGSKLMQFD